MSTEKILNFMAWRKPAAVLSLTLILLSIGSLAVNGLKLGLDFTGGAQVEVTFSKAADLPAIREVLSAQGLENPVAVYFGSDTEILIRTQGAMEDGAIANIRQFLAGVDEDAVLTEVAQAPPQAGDYAQMVTLTGVDVATLQSAEIFPPRYYGATEYRTEGESVQVLLERSMDAAFTDYLLAQLAEANGSEVELQRSEFVGPQIGDELRDEGGLGLLVALLMVMAYVAVRFQYKFSIGAVTALIHDVIIVLGIFSLLQIDFDLTVLAAVLAVIGYSINDTIVVYDRIRENFPKLRRAEVEEVINVSMTQVYERTLITSLTTLLVLVMLFVFGGELIKGFAVALIVGVTVGTYSSIYTAANLLVMLNLTREDLMPPEREESELDQMP